MIIYTQNRTFQANKLYVALRWRSSNVKSLGDHKMPPLVHKPYSMSHAVWQVFVYVVCFCYSIIPHQIHVTSSPKSFKLTNGTERQSYSWPNACSITAKKTQLYSSLVLLVTAVFVLNSINLTNNINVLIWNTISILCKSSGRQTHSGLVICAS